MFTKEQRKNIRNRGKNWTKIHTHVYEYQEFIGYYANVRNGKTFVYNPAIEDYIEKEKKPITYYDYMDISYQGNKIRFHKSEKLFSNVRRHHFRTPGGRRHHTMIWDTDKNLITEIIESKTKSGRTRSIGIRRYNFLNGINCLQDYFPCRQIPEDAWKKIFKTAGLVNLAETKRTYGPFDDEKEEINLEINKNMGTLARYAVAKWQIKNSRFRIPDEILEDIFIETSNSSCLNKMTRIKNIDRFIRTITKNYSQDIRKHLTMHPYKAQFFNWIKKYEDDETKLLKIIEDDKWTLLYTDIALINLLKTCKENDFQIKEKHIINWIFNKAKDKAERKAIIRKFNQIIYDEIDKISYFRSRGKIVNGVMPNVKIKITDDWKETARNIKLIIYKIGSTVNEEMPVQDYKESDSNPYEVRIPKDTYAAGLMSIIFGNRQHFGYNPGRQGYQIVTMWEKNKPRLFIVVNSNNKNTLFSAYEPDYKPMSPENQKIVEDWANANGFIISSSTKGYTAKDDTCDYQDRVPDFDIYAYTDDIGKGVVFK